MEQYHITFDHNAGVSNTAADAISRICPLIENNDFWLRDYNADPVLPDKYFKADGTLLDSTHFSRGRIWDVDRIVVPTARITEVLRNHHSSVLSGHWSTAKTRDLVERRYTFPGLLKAVTSFVEACDICQRTKFERGRHRGLLKAIELPFRRW